jgi:membrane-bound lytic murein transglycosylase A
MERPLIRNISRNFLWLFFALQLLLFSCARPVAPPTEIEAPTTEEPEVVEEPPLVEDAPLLSAVGWDEVPGWHEDEVHLAIEAFLRSCSALRWKDEWQHVCHVAKSADLTYEEEARRFFEENFIPYKVSQSDGTSEGLLTGYYVPDLAGSRYPSSEYPYPLYRRPDDLLVVDLSDLYPSLGDYRLRGRLEGHRVVPYWDRGEIDGHSRPLAGQELFWAADPVELFFLHIQGSGRILFENGDAVMVNYADQNGHPYQSIGKLLLDRGMMERNQMSMQNIRLWAQNNPHLVDELLNENPSYVFFRVLDNEAKSPPGALGVPLTSGRSLAVDRRYIPLGAPVFINTTWPNTDKPLKRLMLAQDTGGAIKGRVRGDFFWGMGAEAGNLAGRMKQQVTFWVLLPVPLMEQN